MALIFYARFQRWSDLCVMAEIVPPLINGDAIERTCVFSFVVPHYFLKPGVFLGFDAFTLNILFLSILLIFWENAYLCNFPLNFH